MLTLNSSETNTVKPKSPGGPKSGDIQKTTTIVMSKHTLAPQPDQVSAFFFFFIWKVEKLLTLFSAL